MQGATLLDTLGRVPLFSELPEDKLAWISERSSEVRLRPGDYVKEAGDPPDGFYVVIEGQIEWTRKVGQQDVYVQSLVAGEFWGLGARASAYGQAFLPGERTCLHSGPPVRVGHG